MQTNLEYIQQLERQRGQLLAQLKEIVRIQEEQFLTAYRAADAINNSLGVGVVFDYAPYPHHQKWYSDAVALIDKLEAK